MTPNLIQENINNLTSLWGTIGKETNAFVHGKDFDYCAITYSEWPNRLWFHQDVTESNLQQAKEVILLQKHNIIIPYWDIYDSGSTQLLKDQGFKALFQQVGMVLKLNKTYAIDHSLLMKEVTDESASNHWEELFFKAFGYRISHQLVTAYDENISFFIAYFNQEPAGTVILNHANNQVMGVHAMGIIPEMRRRGMAEQLMKIVINQAIEQQFEYATLQASAMGQGLYQKLGFVEQFTMTNYSL